MEVRKKKLPIGIESFDKLQTEDFYYVDKTNLIKELLENWAEVNLFTRPRRFGKSLNMSMLKSFFALDGNKEIFSKLKIAEETSLCEAYMEELLDEGISNILKYGIAFYKKRCRVMLAGSGE